MSLVGSAKFHELLAEIGKLHDKKQADYGTSTDPFANIRASEELGIPGYKGSILRANDKMTRIKKWCRDGMLENEGIEDSLKDGAVYLLIALVMYRESREPEVVKLYDKLKDLT